MTSQSDQVVYEFEAGRHTYRASVSYFRGKQWLDLREYYEPEPGQPLAPTRKGVCVGVEYLGELREAIDALAAAVHMQPANMTAPSRQRNNRSRVPPSAA